MSHDMACAKCMDALAEYVAGLGDASERIERHLQSCDRCRAELNVWRAIGAAVGRDVAAIPPDTRESDGWLRLATQLPVSHGQLSSNAAFSATGNQQMNPDHLWTIELNENLVRHPEQAFSLSPANRPVRQWGVAMGAVVALLIVALGAMLFASHASRRSTPVPGSTPVVINAQPGPPLPKGVTMTNVTLAGPGEYWATGNMVTGAKSVILRFSDGRWAQVGDALPSNSLDGLDMVSDSEGWAWGVDVNNANIILHISGGSWQRVTVSGAEPGATPQFIRMSSASDGWLVMQNPKTTNGDTTPSTLLRYTNGSWRVVHSPLPYYSDIAAVGPAEAWVLGGDADSQSIVHVTSGKAVVGLRFPASDKASAGDIGIERLRALTPNDVWATGIRYSAAPATSINWLVSSTPVVYHYDGASWQTVDTHAPTSAQWIEVFSASDMWATRSVMTSDVPGQHAPTRRQIHTLYHLSDGIWREAPLPYSDLSDFAVVADAATATDVWAFASYRVWTPNVSGTGGSGGTYAVLLHYLNGEWTEYGR
jgi:hypothetical protein